MVSLEVNKEKSGLVCCSWAVNSTPRAVFGSPWLIGSYWLSDFLLFIIYYFSIIGMGLREESE